MTLNDTAGLVVSIMTIVASLAASVRWLVKHYLAELRPNGGGSLKDQVNKLELKVNEADTTRKEMSRKLDEMYTILLEHVASSKR